jgi:hypothetical protein
MSTLILGSKENSNIPRIIKNIVFINGSISKLNSIENIVTHERIIHFLARARFYDTPLSKKVEKLKGMKNIKVDSTIIVKRENEDSNYYLDILNQINYKFQNIDFISYKDLTKITTSLVGILNRINYIRCLPGEKLWTKAILLKRLLAGNGQENASIRPSSGVFSILYLIHKNIENDELVISGIGTGEGFHSHDLKIPYNPIHTYVDMKVLSFLNEYYCNKLKIYTTDSNLSVKTGIKLFPLNMSVEIN